MEFGRRFEREKETETETERGRGREMGRGRERKKNKYRWKGGAVGLEEYTSFFRIHAALRCR